MQSRSWLNKGEKGMFTLFAMAVLLAALGCGSGGSGLKTDAKTKTQRVRGFGLIEQ